MRATAKVVAILAATVLAAGALIGTPADASTHREARKPVRPKVGQCRATTFQQSLHDSDPTKPVPCSKTHDLKTFAVITMPKKLLSKHTWTVAVDRFIGTHCYPLFRKAEGGTWEQRAQVDYGYWAFIPTRAEQRKGAHWVRCDVGLNGTRRGSHQGFMPRLPNYPFPLIGSRPVSDGVRVCLADGTSYYATPCSYAHASRSDQTFAMAATPVPTDSQIKAAAQANCPGKRYTSPGSASLWKAGDHVITCYSETTS